MAMSVTELAALPTAPTISSGLREAATYADQAHTSPCAARSSAPPRSRTSSP